LIRKSVGVEGSSSREKPFTLRETEECAGSSHEDAALLAEVARHGKPVYEESVSGVERGSGTISGSICSIAASLTRRFQ